MEELDYNVVGYLESLGFDCYWEDDNIIITDVSKERKKTILRGVARNV